MITEFTEQVKQSILEQVNGLHTALPGVITKYDKDKCEAEILPYGKFEKPDGSFIDYPKINEVPVMVFQGNSQKTTIAYPVLPGDECLLIISEYTLDTWRGDMSESTNDLKFDLTNAVAFVGMFKKPNPLSAEAVDDDALIIEHNKNRVIFKGEDEVKIHLSGDTSFITLKPDGITIETVGDTTVKTTGNTTIETDGDTKIKTAGNTSIETGGEMVIKAGGDLTLYGANIDFNP
ncbi:hypothetical protein FACS1894208_07260 [Clostridia bacterium]|nr:hypothetical protein FACS1894208_07260 [Clostridia bacterium]